jgi:signal transduction histidine kinase
VLDWLAPDEHERFSQLARRVLRDGGGQRAELDVLLEGERRTYDFRVERAEHGVSVVGFDVTASRRAEATLRDADHRKDEFLATLSHELRNPLTPLKVALDVAKLAGPDPAQLAQAHGIMDRQVVQLTQLVDDLLDLSRVTQGKIAIQRVVLDPVRVIDAALEATQPLLRQRNHRLTVSLPDVSVRVLGDHGRLTQVLTNLLNNAAKYTPSGGEITVAMAVNPARDAITVQVADNGNGIAPELLPRIFEIFVQGRDDQGRAHGGLGIGLNLARRLIELHGGKIAAASPGLGHGTTLTIELPLASIGSSATRSPS